MKKTFSISLAQTIFHAEEDAYEKLDQYLNSVKAHFATYPERDEILKDMEARIAEQFLSTKQSGDKVITLPDVENLIKTMGQVEDFDDLNSETKSTEPLPKKLYRNTEDQIVAGVASGIAMFFSIDPLIVRLMFALSVLVGGFGVFLYCVLWLILPEAKTSNEKMQMKGEQINLSIIEETVRKKFNGIPEATKSSFRRFFDAIGKIIRWSVWFIAIIILAIITFGTAIALIALTITLIITLFNGRSELVDFPLALIADGPIYYGLLSAAYLTAAIPLVLLLALAVGAIRKKKLLNYVTVFVLVGLWLIAVSAAASIGINLAPEYEAKINNLPGQQQVSRIYDLKDFEKVELNSAISAKLIQGKTYSVKASGRQKDIDRLELTVGNKTLSNDYKNEFKLCFFCFESRKSVTLEITMPTLNEVYASGATKLEIEKFESDTLSVRMHGASNLTADLEVKNLMFELHGGSKLLLVGTGEKLIAQMHGASRFDARDLILKQAEIESHGASTIVLNVTDDLKVEAHGASRIYYKGEPDIEQDLSGASKIQKLNENEELLDFRARPIMPPMPLMPFDDEIQFFN